MTPTRLYALVLAFGTATAPHGIAGICAAQGDDPVATVRPATAGSLAQRFATTDQAELLLLLDELGHGPGDARQAARLVGELLLAGQSDAVTDHALSSLGRLGVREGRASLLAYLGHRRVETRTRAYEALGQLRDRSDTPTLALGLRDSAPDVRATAARALGELRAADAAPLLLRALTRGVAEAAAALGKAGDAASVDEFGKQLGKQSLDVMLTGYANYLAREDLGDPVKLKIIAALENVAGGRVKQFLSEQSKTSRSQKLQRAMLASAARIKLEAPSPPSAAPAPAAAAKEPVR